MGIGSEVRDSRGMESNRPTLNQKFSIMRFVQIRLLTEYRPGEIVTSSPKEELIISFTAMEVAESFSTLVYGETFFGQTPPREIVFIFSGTYFR